MEEVLLFLSRNQNWIYLLLGFLGLIYLRSTMRSWREYRAAFFSLERDRARERLVRGILLLSLSLIAVLGVFLVANFASPAVPLERLPTPVPTVSLLDQPALELSAVPPEGQATPIANQETSPSGCDNPNATILAPKDGETVSGIVEIRGVANIPAFAFYKIEMRETGEGEWRAILAGTEPVCEDLCPVEGTLGRWDTSLLMPGDYMLRLVVTDAVGNAPLPCTVNLRIVPSE
jgi:hypothetical protein